MLFYSFYTGPVRDQGKDCNAATYMHMADIYSFYYNFTQYSAQQILDCSYQIQQYPGCAGGGIEQNAHYLEYHRLVH